MSVSLFPVTHSKGLGRVFCFLFSPFTDPFSLFFSLWGKVISFPKARGPYDTPMGGRVEDGATPKEK